jgi:diguanylate cyclase (GGDEF)-like protein
VARGCQAPVIFLTGVDDEETDVKAMKAGAADYLVKGQFDSRQLERSIRHAFQLRKAQDRREAFAAEDEIRRAREETESARTLAWTDVVTGLGNRRYAEHAIHTAIAERRPFSLLVFDLNGFKPINDRYGHNQGDYILRAVAHGLRSAVRDSDVVCRWGGDEFVILLYGAALPDAQQRALRVQAKAFGEFTVEAGGQRIKVNADAAVGAAEYQQGETASAFFERADQLMLACKREQYRTNRARYSQAGAPRPTLVKRA